jgi:hypothetical protein
MIDPINPAAVIPAKAGIQFQATAAALEENWIPAFAGMTPYLWGAVSANRRPS